MKYVLFVILTIFAAACSKCPETTLTTNNVSVESMPQGQKNVSVESMSQGQKVVCNEFGVAYYEFTAGYGVYVPVYRHYPTGGVYPVSCEEYNNYINKRDANGKMSR